MNTNKINIRLFVIFFSIIFTSCVDFNLPNADATFIIEKDTVINGIKSRVEVTTADTINPVYFVYKGNSTFNSVWPGDIYKSTTSIRASLADKPKSTTFLVSQDYDSRKDSVLMTLAAKKDTFMTQGAIIYKGIALPNGTTEINYTFKSKGALKVTWIARNANSKLNSEAILQKTILVK